MTDGDVNLSELSDDELYLQVGDDLYDGLADEVVEAVEIFLDRGKPPYEIMTQGLVAGMHIVGEDFRDGILFVPEVLMAAKAMKAGMAILQPLLAKSDAPKLGVAVIGTVKGDIHDLGKNIVIMMLKGNGWDVTDLGVDISPDEFCTAVAEGDYHILGLSSLLTMTMPHAADTIEALKANGLRDKIKVMVGGAPTRAEWAQKIGADAHAKDGPSAARKAAELIANT